MSSIPGTNNVALKGIRDMSVSRQSSSVSTTHSDGTEANPIHLKLIQACRESSISTIHSILEVFPDLIDKPDWGGTTPLQLACMLRNYTAAETLIEYGANLLLTDKSGKSALSYIKDEIMKDLLHSKFVHQKNGTESKEKPLTDIEVQFQSLRDEIFKGEEAVVDSIIFQWPSLINFQDRRGYTGLMFACMSSQIPIAINLLHHGALSYIKNCYGQDSLALTVDLRVRDELTKLAYDLSPEGIVAIEAERLRLELGREQSERSLMTECDNYAVDFAIKEAKYIAFETREMRTEEKNTRVFLKKLRLMHVSVRKEVARNCYQSVVSEGMSIVKAFRMEQFQAEKEARRLHEIRLRKLAKADKVRKLRALLHDQDPLAVEIGHLHPDEVELHEHDLDEDVVLRAIVEKERRKEMERQQAEARKRAQEEADRLAEAQRQLRDAQRIARLEWNQLQADIRHAEKLEFEKNKPIRLMKLGRQRLAMSRI